MSNLYSLLRKIVYRPMYFIKKNMAKQPKVNSTDETLNQILKNRCSVSRYGDGEFMIMMGKDIIFQEADEKLIYRLNEIIKTTNNNHIVCIPNTFSNIDMYTKEAKEHWINFWAKYSTKVYKLIDMNKIYYDTQISRPYFDYKDKSNVYKKYEKIKLIWKEKDIIIVEGEKSRLGVGNDLFKGSKSIKRILCPSKNAYKFYNEILEEVLKQSKDKLILIALGPTATVLSYDLHKKGYQSIDIGHLDIEYEWFLQGAVEKVNIPNKFVAEAKNRKLDEDNDIIDINYKNQIISVIG